MAVSRFHLAVGKQNIRASAVGPAASLGRDVREQFREIEANFNDLCGHMGKQLPNILLAALEPTFKISQKYCPKDSHELVESGYLEVESFRNSSRCEMGYGRNGSPNYAIYVHEMPYAHEAPTRSKFLEAAVDEDFYAVMGRVAKLAKYASGV
jgi:hypothetical protein